MNCTCPKCHAEIELPLTNVGEEGTAASCPACKAGFFVFKESFGARALRKSGEISCASCGNILGPQLHCASCGEPFPDYLVAAGSRKKVRRKSSPLNLQLTLPKRKAKASSQLPTLGSAMMQRDGAPPKKEAAAGSERRKLSLLVIVLVLVAVAAAGAGIFLKKKAETSYMTNFTLAAYGIQVGADTSRRACQRMAEEWKAGIESGGAFTPRPSMQTEKELNSIRTKLDSVKAKFSEEPEKFKNCNERIAMLEGAYVKLQTLALSPGKSLPAFTDSLNKLDGDYKKAAQEFKGGLPPELMEELQTAAKKYRGLRPLLK